MDIGEKIKGLPNTPGVYLMKGSSGEVLYVGKAGNLKKRVSSYFHSRKRLPERLIMLVQRIEDISYIPTSTEAEALIYENGLIKQLAPRYNVALKDGKSYPILKLTVTEAFPRLFITRQRKEDGALYFGPYSDAKLLREAFIILRQIFPLRSCGKLPHSPCLNYHLKLCHAPCAGKISAASYGDIVAELKLFLDGRRTELIAFLSDRMLEASKRERFEEAAAIKRRIEALSSIKESAVSYRPMDELDELKNILSLDKLPQTIEAFDVSNIMGAAAVGSMVCFYKGRPKKSEYRMFRIRQVSGIDDYSMIRELVRRRYSRLLEEKKPLPDLILIDGGRGHLNAALDELKAINLSGLQVISIAKEFEHIYTRDGRGPVVLPREAKTLHLLKRIRDEAHRFAISYHKRLFSKELGRSELDGIAGIGPLKKKALIKHFGTIDKIKNAGVGDILKVRGMDESSARSIFEHFKE